MPCTCLLVVLATRRFMQFLSGAMTMADVFYLRARPLGARLLMQYITGAMTRADAVFLMFVVLAARLFMQFLTGMMTKADAVYQWSWLLCSSCSSSPGR